jgi:glyoxylase-like metal-dependent hydrolase (beta-lactamase superfamily II)
MKTGRVDVWPVSDGIGWWDGGGAFGLVPKTRWQKLLPADENNRVPMVLRCLLIRSAGKIIVVDTGLGERVTPEVAAQQDFELARPHGGLLDDLARHGVRPGDVDIVLLTHLHADHCGGSTVLREGQLVPAFPRAQYWIQRHEWQDAHHTNERTRATYLGDNFDPLEAAGRLRLIEGDTQVTDEVRTVITPGHTPAHQSVMVESEGQTLFFTGDMALWRWNIERLAWVTAYDLEPMVTIETKRRWQAWLAERQAVIVFDHDPLIEAGVLRREQDGRYAVDVILPVAPDANIAT